MVQGVDFLIHGRKIQRSSGQYHHPHRNIQAYWMAVPVDYCPGEMNIAARVNYDSPVPDLKSDELSIECNEQGWQALQFESGWTSVEPVHDSRLVYVAENGDDERAAEVHGRGYYLPGDPEIGPDPSNPQGEIAAYSTPSRAMQQIRLTNWIEEDNGRDVYADEQVYALHRDTLGHDWTGYPDWILYRRGDDFREHQQPDSENYRPRSHGLRQRGRSINEPMVITAWGPSEKPRPVLEAWHIPGHARHLRLISLDLKGRLHWDSGAQGQLNNAWWAEDILVEDLRARGMGASNIAAWDGILVRRSAVLDAWDADSHVQGLYIDNLDRAGQLLDQGPPDRIWPQDSWTIEESLFDRNGYKQDPNEPGTWTRDVNRCDYLEPGKGVQPVRTFFDRNIYADSYGSLHLRGNIFSRNGGGGSVQMRQGGIAEHNLFMWNESALSTSHPQSQRDILQDAVIRSNVVLHDDHFLPPGGFGQGLRIGAGPEQSGVMNDNTVAHFHRISNSGAMLEAGGIPSYRDTGDSGHLPALQAGHVTVHNNIGISRSAASLLIHGPDTPKGVSSATLHNNSLLNTEQGKVVSYSGPEPSNQVCMGDTVLEGNYYYQGGSSRFEWGDRQRGDFSKWQEHGFDDYGLAFFSPQELAQAAGWYDSACPEDEHPVWERDILSYMLKIDPHYEPDPDVYVDAGTDGKKQETRLKVRKVLEQFQGFPHDGGTRPEMSREQATLTAKRYHAFMTFTERARKNRKGNWDPRYTAQALNGYISLRAD